MKRYGAAFAALAGSVCLLSGATFEDTQHKTFSLTANGGERRLIIRNVQGDIRVTGTTGNEIRVTLKERWSADTQADLDRARTNMPVRIQQEGNLVKFGLESNCCGGNGRNDWGRDVSFRHDYDVQVPRDVMLELGTVNGSEVSVNGSDADFAMRNVNGQISLRGMTGSGSVKTVNGKVSAVFSRNPARPVSFETVNGTLDVTFQPGLNADLALNTLHGEVYTDFEVQPLATPARVEQGNDGRRFRISRNRNVRIGAGGVEHSFKTLNGTIKIRQGEK